MTSRGHEERLAGLGIELPAPSRPVASYLSCKRSGDLRFVGGHGPVGPGGVVRGKVGGDVDLAGGREAARRTAAVGMAELPFDIAVEIEMVLEVDAAAG